MLVKNAKKKGKQYVKGFISKFPELHIHLLNIVTKNMVNIHNQFTR